MEKSDCEWMIVANFNNGFAAAQHAEFEDPKKWTQQAEFHSLQLWLRIYQHR